MRCHTLPDKQDKDNKKPVGRLLWAYAQKLAFVLIVLVIILLLGSLLNDPATTSGPIYLALINIDLILAALLAFFIGRKVLMMFLERKKGLIGARLHVRLIGIFSLLAVVPAVVVSIYAGVILQQGMESWFSSRVTNVLDNSLKVSQAYFNEHGNSLLTEVISLAKDPNIRTSSFFIDTESIEEALREEMVNRNLSELSIYNKDGSLFARVSDMTPTALSTEMLTIISSDNPKPYLAIRHVEGRIIAMSPVNESLFLTATKWVHPSVLAHMDETKDAYQEYYRLRSDRNTVRLIFALILLLLTVFSLGWAIWAGLKLASRIVKPVTSLVHATNQVSAGDLDVHLDPLDDDEVGILTQAFNRMTRQMKENRSLLERKNSELDDRRKTMEGVFTGVSAGILSLDGEGVVKMANKTAREVIKARMGSKIGKFCPELEREFTNFTEKNIDIYQEQVRVNIDDETLTLLVRMVPQRAGGGKIQSVVITFDDVTALLSAQNLAAWADVAQRIAHEIKNPLTPIQLSAERLRRKYSKEITSDKETFDGLTATIVRQVDDLRKLVNEFSDFARMPAAKFEDEDIISVIDEILLLEREARPHINFVTEFEKSNIKFVCDRSQISRALTNVIQNGINSIEENAEKNKKAKKEIKIVVKMSQDGMITVSVKDTGGGLPDGTDAERLFDPYVTTRSKGTGLGLSIVRRVVGEHGGQIRLLRRKSGGAQVEITFPPSQR
jgi:two-component system nitrogen regulation sensor histidine kinase NtrY